MVKTFTGYAYYPYCSHYYFEKKNRDIRTRQLKQDYSFTVKAKSNKEQCPNCKIKKIQRIHLISSYNLINKIFVYAVFIVFSAKGARGGPNI